MSVAPTPAEVFKALGDQQRLRMLAFIARSDSSCCLTTHGVCACDLQVMSGLSQPTVSHHLKILTDAGLITATKQGKWVYYALSIIGSNIAHSTLKQLSSRHKENA